MSELLRIAEFEIPTREPPERIRFLVNGYHSFSGSGSFHLGESEPESLVPWLRPLHRNFHIPRHTKSGELTSSMFGALQVPGEPPLTVGVVGLGDYFAQVRVSRTDTAVKLWVQLQLEGQPPPSKKPEIFVGRGPVWQELDRYTRAWGLQPRPVPSGWCSWYHYYTLIDEPACHRNLALAPQFPVKVFQLDDGYQRELGDWLTTNSKFPSGLGDLARRTRDAGMVPGLWLAPFFARKDHGWVLRDARGRPVKALWNPTWGAHRFVYALDSTHPGLIQYLRDLFAKLRSEGFGFFKLDFLYAGALPGVRQDRSLTSLQALRRALQVIRETVGDDTYLLGCGCPLEAGIGVVDSMRVGNDVTLTWSSYVDRWIGRGFEQLSTRNNIRNTLVRAPLNLRWFHSDPDCLLTKGINPTEQRTLAQVNALSGGTLMISDDLAALTPERRAIISEAFQLSKEVLASPRVFAAPDLMERQFPELQLALGEKDALLGIYNFTEKPAPKSVRLRDFIPWPRFTVDGKEAGDVHDAGEIEPHGARLLRIRQA
ncbi:MAG TPA: glycoside hydrolase family 36 protein [Myxococcaceae bacterium]|nr:glycoside hydrolase family 36 protein [Myxococcaceae bacterium]